MGRLLDQLHEDTHAWAAKGHKANRARQRRMMMAFAGHAEALGAREAGQVGGRTVIAYFKALAQETGVPYQNLINLYLSECAHSGKKLSLTWAS